MQQITLRSFEGTIAAYHHPCGLFFRTRPFLLKHLIYALSLLPYTNINIQLMSNESHRSGFVSSVSTALTLHISSKHVKQTIANQKKTLFENARIRNLIPSQAYFICPIIKHQFLYKKCFFLIHFIIKLVKVSILFMDFFSLQKFL